MVTLAPSIILAEVHELLVTTDADTTGIGTDIPAAAAAGTDTTGTVTTGTDTTTTGTGNTGTVTSNEDGSVTVTNADGTSITTAGNADGSTTVTHTSATGDVLNTTTVATDGTTTTGTGTGTDAESGPGGSSVGQDVNTPQTPFAVPNPCCEYHGFVNGEYVYYNPSARQYEIGAYSVLYASGEGGEFGTVSGQPPICTGPECCTGPDCDFAPPPIVPPPPIPPITPPICTGPDCEAPPPTTCEQRGDCPTTRTTCEQRGDCPGTCSNPPCGPGSCSPNRGNTCTTSTNSCGAFNAGRILCDGSCSVGNAPPSNNQCPVPRVTFPGPGSTGISPCTITWSATQVTSCTLTGPGVNVTGTSGSVRTPRGATQQASYLLTCYNGPEVYTARTALCRPNPQFEEF